MKYVIWEPRLTEFEEKIAPLNKRAARLGLPPVTVTEVGREMRACEVAERVHSFRCFVTVEVDGVEPVFEGWHFECKVEHVVGGNLVTKFPGEHEDVPEARTVKPTCDHCEKVRSRKLTYYVRHAEQGLKHVGSTCLGAFLPSVDPQALAAMLQAMGAFVAEIEGGESDDDYDGRMGGGYYQYPVEDVFAVALAAVRTFGWVKARPDEFGALPTKDRVADYFGNPRSRGGLDKPDVKWPEAAEVAEGLAVMRARPTETDFDSNVAVVLAGEYTDLRRVGLVAAAAMVYDRGVKRAAEAAAEAAGTVNEHFGEVGQRMPMTLTVTFARVMEGHYGMTTLVKFRTADGRMAAWFASGDRSEELPVGKTFQTKATVKRHDERDGRKVTMLTRVA